MNDPHDPVGILDGILSKRAEHGLSPRAPVKRDNDPIQRPGVDHLVNRQVVGGPDSSQDIRFVASTAILEPILEAASQSKTRRALIQDVSIRVLTLQSPQGHVFQVLSLVGRMPVPEVPVIFGPQAEASTERSLVEPERIPDGFVVRSRAEQSAPDDGPPFIMFVSREMAEQLMGRARASRTSRALVPQAGVVLETYMKLPDESIPPAERERPRPSVYHVLSLIGLMPKPEDPAIVAGSSL